MVAAHKKEKKPWSTKRKVLFLLLIIIDIALIGAAFWLWYDKQQEYDHVAAQVEVAQQSVQPGTQDEPPVVDWAALKAQNSDVCAWVQIPDTPVNFPVYQGATNDTYLRTGADGNYSLGGLVFIDSQNTGPNLEDMQTMVYGHHLQDGSMFAWIDTMNQQQVFDEHSRIWWVTEQANYALTPLFTYVLPESGDLTVQLQWPDLAAFRAHLAQRLGQANACRPDAAEVISRTDHVLTLVTCNYDNGRGRTLVVCVPQSVADGTTATAAS